MGESNYMTPDDAARLACREVSKALDKPELPEGPCVFREGAGVLLQGWPFRIRRVRGHRIELEPDAKFRVQKG